MEVDASVIVTAVIAVSTAVGGFASGRAAGRINASQVAVDTVDMLQSQIEVLKEDRDQKEIELADLKGRVSLLEGLVTQRAEVEEVNIKASLIKETVDRIAERVGA